MCNHLFQRSPLATNYMAAFMRGVGRPSGTQAPNSEKCAHQPSNLQQFFQRLDSHAFDKGCLRIKGFLSALKQAWFGCSAKQGGSGGRYFRLLPLCLRNCHVKSCPFRVSTEHQQKGDSKKRNVSTPCPLAGRVRRQVGGHFLSNRQLGGWHHYRSAASTKWPGQFFARSGGIFQDAGHGNPRLIHPWFIYNPLERECLVREAPRTA